MVEDTRLSLRMMRAERVAAACLAAVAGLWTRAEAQTNDWLLNPGFEREAAGWPVEWSLAWGDRSHARWTRESPHSGQHCLKLVAPCAVKSAALPYDGERLIVTAWMKLVRLRQTERAPAYRVAGVQLVSLDANRKADGHKDLILASGTQAWTRYRREFLFPRTTRFVEVQLVYYSPCAGEAWFDDVQVTVERDWFQPRRRPFDAARARVTVDAARSVGPLPNLWRCIDNSYMTELTLPEKASLLPRFAAVGIRSVRLHETLYGPRIYKEVDGRPVYDWTRFDAALDLLRDHGLRPYIVLESTPNEMAAEKVESYRNISKVSDLKRWEALIRQVVRHCVERYGEDEVAQWRFELWNEPDAKGYYKGTLADYLAMYDATVRGATAAFPRVRIGGCGGAGNGWVLPFIEHCAAGVRMDFISWHIYCAGTGVPNFSVIERSIVQVKKWLKRFPQFRDTPLIISEWSCNSSPEPWLNGSYRAPFMLRALLKMDELGIKRAYNFSTCEYLWRNEQKLFQGGLGFFTAAGVPKACFHLFEFLQRMQGVRVSAVTSNEPLDVLAAWDAERKTLRVLLGNYVEDPTADFTTEVSMTGRLPTPVPGACRVRTWRVTPEVSNAYDDWLKLGKPKVSLQQWRDYSAGRRETEEQRRVADLIDHLKRTAELAPPSEHRVAADDEGQFTLSLLMPVFSIHLLEVTIP